MAKKYTAQEARLLILEVACKLFVEKGYEKTSISDIVKGLDGLSKGALYHHFSSKDEIIDEIVRSFVPDKNTLDIVMKQDKLNGLNRVQALLFMGMFNSEASKSRLFNFTLLDNPKFFSMYIRTTNEVMAPLVESCLIEGNKDGSIIVELPKQMAELTILILSTWFIQALFPNTAQTFFDKLAAAKIMLDNSGLYILSDEFLEVINQQIVVRIGVENE